MPSLPPTVLLALALQNAPQVAPETMLAVVQAETGGDPLALYDNADKQGYRPKSKAEAVALARRLVAAGHSIDAGVAQLNSANWPRFNVTAETAFDPAVSIKAAGELMVSDYRICLQMRLPKEALRCMISRYNTGDGFKGVGNGYVAKVWKAADLVVPAIKNAGPLPPPPPAETPDDDPSDPAPPAWDVFARADWEMRRADQKAAAPAVVKVIQEPSK